VHNIYLDFNCTTPLAPSVREAMEPFWSEHFMLPGQGHRGCQAVADALERAREGVADMLGCEGFEIVFTGGGTEANNLGVLGLANRSDAGHVVVSALEHESVWNAVGSLETRGWQIDVAPASESGIIEVEAVERLLRPETKLVCLQAANPVLGTCQPVRQVADLCHSRGIPVHCDAVQMFGKLPLNIAELRADTIAISGHKFYAPKGVGALYVRRGFSLSPVVFGETREMGLRPGAENVAGWVGLGAAAKLAARCAEDVDRRMQELRKIFLDRLRSQLDSELKSWCEDEQTHPYGCLANTILLELPKDANKVARTARQVIFATPRAANPADEMTRCLQAIGLDAERIRRCCRLSLGWTTSQEQIERAADYLSEACDLH
jgi:cysteine desulfurase